MTLTPVWHGCSFNSMSQEGNGEDLQALSRSESPRVLINRANDLYMDQAFWTTPLRCLMRSSPVQFIITEQSKMIAKWFRKRREKRSLKCVSTKDSASGNYKLRCVWKASVKAKCEVSGRLLQHHLPGLRWSVVRGVVASRETWWCRWCVVFQDCTFTRN